MAQVLNLNPITCLSRSRLESGKQSWVCLQQRLKCHPKFSCIFSGNSSSRREEQARKSLESALGGKKNEFEKWNKEIKKREEAGGGANSGGGGWFGWGGRFGWSNGDNFWSEAQQTGLTILAIFAMYLLVAKGEVMLAVIVNTALKALRGTRNGFSLITSTLLKKTSPDSSANFDDTSKKPVLVQASAKERVLRKWGSD